MWGGGRLYEIRGEISRAFMNYQDAHMAENVQNRAVDRESWCTMMDETLTYIKEFWFVEVRFTNFL